MAILLTKETNTTPILVKGSNIELDSVYVRIVFVCNLDGSLTINFNTYLNHTLFLEGKEIETDIKNITYNFVINEFETQSLETALNYMFGVFTELGYSASII
jgi:hypothetical protein